MRNNSIRPAVLNAPTASNIQPSHPIPNPNKMILEQLTNISGVVINILRQEGRNLLQAARTKTFPTQRTSP